MQGSRQAAPGVSLYEVLIALVAVGLIFMLTVRYYQSVKDRQLATDALQSILAIGPLADTVVANSPEKPSSNAIVDFTGAFYQQGITFPWDKADIGLAVEQNGNYLIQINNVPPRVCNILFSQLKENKSYFVQNNCSAEAGDILIEYIKA